MGGTKWDFQFSIYLILDVHHVVLVAIKMIDVIVSKSPSNGITMRKRKKMALFQILQRR
jgi:hypothetical protein